MSETEAVGGSDAPIESSAPTEAPTEVQADDSSYGSDGLQLPDGQRLFDREYVTKLRDEAASYRTQMRELEERNDRYGVFEQYEDDDRAVWIELAKAWQDDPYQAAEAMREIAGRVLGPQEQQQVLDAVDSELEGIDDEFITADKVQQIVNAELQRQEAAREMDSMVEGVYTEMRTAGVDPSSLDGYMVLWRASNETSGDIGKALRAHEQYKQGIIDNYVQSKTAGGGGAPPANGTTGVQRKEPATLDDAFAAGRAFLSNGNPLS